MANEVPQAKTLMGIMDPTGLEESRSGRVLSAIRRDLDLKDHLMRRRRHNEEVLSLKYQDGELSGVMGGGSQDENLRENALNLPYRYARWLESQATSKRMVVGVNRNAGAGQKPGGPGDEEIGMWREIALERVAYEAGFDREIKAVINEVLPRGTSVMQIGYHLDVVSAEDVREVGKDAQSVVADVLGEGDVVAKPGQAHAEISDGLANIASSEEFQLVAGSEGVDAILARKDAHDEMDAARELDDSPSLGARETRWRLWMRKRRVGEDVGWAPWVYDTEDSDFWWERQTMTVAQVRQSDLFTDDFKAVVEGYDGRNISGVARGGQTPSTDDMGSDARQAQSEDVLDEDERIVEFFVVWMRRPGMRSGGIRKIVAAEYPDDFVEADESNPYVDEEGYPLIPGFYPFYDFTPILSSQTVPERTCGIPPIAVGMPQFDRIAEYNRLRHESALRHSLRMYQLHDGLRDNKDILDAIKNGRDGYAFFAPQSMINDQGKMEPAVLPIQFTGNTQEIERQAAREESDWVKVMGMPPAILQNMGTAETATQDQIGVAAGERESGSLVAYFEKRMGDVLRGLQGLMRGCYDDEDFIAMLGEEGAQHLKAWQIGTQDEGDEITVTFGARATAQETVDRKQLMEAITLLKADLDPLTQLPRWDTAPLVEELMRRLDQGKPRENASTIRQLQMLLAQLLQQVQAQQGSGVSPDGGGASDDGGPNPSEGEGPTNGNLSAGARRGAVPKEPFETGLGAGAVPAGQSG